MRIFLLCSAFAITLAPSLCSLAQPRVTEISIGGYRFDPAQGIPADASRRVPFEEPGPDVEHWRIIQLNRAPDRATQTTLKERYGLELRRFVQGGAYLERITSRTARELVDAGLARASVAYHPSFKYSRSIGTGQFVTSERQAVRGLLLRAVLFDRADIQQTERAITAISGANDVRAIDDRRSGGTGQIVFRLESTAGLPAVASIDGVALIEEIGEIVEDNVASATILQSGIAGQDPLWMAGLTGRGQIVDVVERTPPDFNHCFFRDPANPIGPSHRKVEANLHPPGTTLKTHGTFIPGSVLGDDVNNPGHHPHRGGAWAARLVASSNQDLLTATAYIDELTTAAGHGAFIHTNSWHDQRKEPDPALPHYTAYQTDRFAWDHEEHLIIGAIANDASGYKLGPPGTAKNALGVSAAQKTDPLNHGQGLAGPFDMRSKPDLTAVGCDVQSALLTDTTNQCKTGPDVPCSTSDATAHAAAAATLVRQYYTDGWYPSGSPTIANRRTPSGALIKATLLNSTRDTGGDAYQSNTKGWGVITLDRTLFLPNSPRTLAVWDVRNTADDSLVTSYEPEVLNGAEYTVSVVTAGEPLRVTLVWTDDPGQFANGAVTNDLDLQVIGPNPSLQSYLGNHFVGGASATGGGPDGANNVEQVLVNNPTPGAWVIRVIATNVQVGSQGYALVATSGIGK